MTGWTGQGPLRTNQTDDYCIVYLPLANLGRSGLCDPNLKNKNTNR